MGDLGLVLRPNHKHVQTALQYCYDDPVEFLLILYQLIKPRRTQYSINDRLLLSAVVHLTITDTLRELHKRIPSPPKLPPAATKKVVACKKTKEIGSPYLEIFSFKPKPRPHAGEIYKNNVAQYPESPYFSYLPNFRKMQLLAPEYKWKNFGMTDGDETIVTGIPVEALSTSSKR